MPLESPASYPATLVQFLAHWESVNSALSGALVLLEGDREDGVALGVALKQRMDGVVAAMMAVTLAREGLVDGRAQVRGLLQQFHAAVRAYWPGTPWAGLARRLPPVESALDKFLRPCRSGSRLWRLVEAEPAPVGAPSPVLIGPGHDVGREEFEEAVEGVRLQGLGLEEAEWALDVARARRNAVMLQVRGMLVSYVKALPSRVPAGHYLLDSLPRLWPLPGHTPSPVRAAGAWVPERKVARLTWSESKDAALDHYEVRVCAGPEYSREDEVVLAEVPAGAERVLETGLWPGRAGAAASFRVYVVLRTGNARASGVVVVRQPEE